MKQATIVVKPFVAEKVLQTIESMDPAACIVQEAKGFSRQKGYLDRYVGSEYTHVFLPRVEINIWIEDERVDELAERVMKAARTGRIGDGKVMIVGGAWPTPLEF